MKRTFADTYKKALRGFKSPILEDGDVDSKKPVKTCCSEGSVQQKQHLKKAITSLKTPLDILAARVTYRAVPQLAAIITVYGTR